MKKLLALALTLMMLFAFTACGKDDDDKNGGFNINLPLGTDTGIQETPDSVIDIPAVDSNVVTPDNEYEDNLNNAVEVTLPSSSSTTSVAKGTVLGSNYTSTSAGVRFTLPSGWRFYTDQELAALINATASDLGIENFEDTLANQVSVYDMMAINNTTQESVMVLYENTIKSANTSVTAAEYADAVKSRLETMGYTVSYAESAFLGNTQFVSMTATYTVSGVTLEQKYYCRSLGDYVASVILTSNGNTSIDELASLFY